MYTVLAIYSHAFLCFWGALPSNPHTLVLNMRGALDDDVRRSKV